MLWIISQAISQMKISENEIGLQLNKCYEIHPSSSQNQSNEIIQILVINRNEIKLIQSTNQPATRKANRRRKSSTENYFRLVWSLWTDSQSFKTTSPEDHLK